jgi:trehalose utilization protein
MELPLSRREFLGASATAVGGFTWLSDAAQGAAADEPKNDKKVKVVVWDEQQPEQKEAYPDFLGNHLAKYLGGRPGLAVKSVKLADSEQGLSDEILGDCRVLVWWGHKRHSDVKPEAGKKVVERIKDGKLSLLALHSAHWSTPFVEAMNERTRQNAEKKYAADGQEKVEIKYVAPPQRYTMPKADALVTPYAVLRKFPENLTRVAVYLPFCCFPAYRTDGKPSSIKVKLPEHPIAKGLPRDFELPHTEMYDEPFHVPEPDEVVLEERWANGEWFRSGMAWKIGRGKVFYLRPGHETFAVFHEKPMLQLVDNTVRWLAEG